MVWVWIKPLIIFDAKSDADFHGDWCFSMKPLRVWMFCLLVWCIRYIDSYHLIPICLFCPGLWEVNWYSGNLTNIKHGFVFAPGRMARASIHQLHACVLRSSLYFYRSRDIFFGKIVFHRISSYFQKMNFEWISRIRWCNIFWCAFSSLPGSRKWWWLPSMLRPEPFQRSMQRCFPASFWSLRFALEADWIWLDCLLSSQARTPSSGSRCAQLQARSWEVLCSTDSEKHFSKQLQGSKKLQKRSAFPVTRLC